MEITWLGRACFRLRGRDVTVLTDPYPIADLKLTGVSADIATLSYKDPETDEVPQKVSTIKGVRRVVSGPGEYEIAGALITGIRTYRDAVKGRERGKNTSYLIEIDGVTVCHLGDIGHVPSAADISELGRAEVLLVPVDGTGGLDVKGAIETITQLSPRLAVPMLYYLGEPAADSDPIERLVREMGLSEVETESRLTVTPTNMPLDTKVVRLEPRSGG